MRFDAPLREAVFRERLNRFLALASIDGEPHFVHVANSGRLRELLVPGVPIWLAPRVGIQRKTRYDLALVALDGGLASADARLPSPLIAEAIQAGRLEAFAGYTEVGREFTFGESRIDLLLRGEGAPCLLETKSVTLVEDGLALFPDSPTLRGAKHLRSLMAAKAVDYRAAVVFVIQRADARCFAPNDGADSFFGGMLREAAGAGVEVHAYGCTIALDEIRLAGPLPIHL
ncbi:MAG: DNA/RNA nuclease SfsA [Chloroflexi bacterium]|nr:DNA/RNA nuclease SfsA [Chloroflexota bacterium]